MLAELLVEARELEMRVAALVESRAGIEETARFAPQLGLRAQAAECRQQFGVAAAAGEPALAALEAQPRLLGARARVHAGRQLAVLVDQRRDPLLFESLFQDLARQRRAPQHGGVARRGGGDARLRLVVRLQRAPAP